MADSASSSIETGGGTFARGNVQTGGGAFVGRDQYIQYVQLDVAKLGQVLKQALPPGDPAPQLWLEALQDFQRHHTLLFEWKELHNFLNDLLMAMGQLKREVERIDITGETPNPRALARLWRPVVQKIDAMLEWAKSIRHISNQPFLSTDETSQGPSWAVELFAAELEIDQLLDRQVLACSEIYDAVFNISDLAEKHMYLTDKMLRTAAGELYNLSTVVLGRMGHE